MPGSPVGGQTFATYSYQRPTNPLSEPNVMKTLKAPYVKTLRAVAGPARTALVCILTLGAVSSAAWAARLVHSDKTVIEGKILSETPDKITIETRYGVFAYSPSEIVEITRDQPPPTPTPVAAAPTPVNYQSAIPAGPVDPFNPPKLPNLMEMARQKMTPPPDPNAPVPIAPRHDGASTATSAAASPTTASAGGARPTPVPAPTPVM